MQDSELSHAQHKLVDIWRAHAHAEFVARDAAAALESMVEEPHVLLVPTGFGGMGRQAVRHFYENQLIPHLPLDLRSTLLSYTAGVDRLVEESVFEFTHAIELPWLLPGIARTGLPVRLPVVAVVQFAGDKISHVHVYYDHGAVLAQLGLLRIGPLAVRAGESATKLLAASGVA